MIPIPNLSLGFTGSTTRPENYGDVGGGLNTGGLTFGGKAGNGKTLALIAVGLVAVFLIARKL